jgi:hypothetical protein
MDVTEAKPPTAHFRRSGFRHAYSLPPRPNVRWEAATLYERRVLSAWAARFDCWAQGLPFRPSAASQRALGATLAALDAHSLQVTTNRLGS